jgi:ribonuclease E
VSPDQPIEAAPLPEQDQSLPAEPAVLEKAQAPEPKPKPVRTGPPRKGWWQRRIG